MASSEVADPIAPSAGALAAGAGGSVGEVSGRIEHLLVRAPNWVGDLAMATPVLEAALADPRFARVTIGLRGGFRPILEEGPCEGHLFDLGGRSEEVARIASLRADAVLLLSNSSGSAWRAFRAGIPVRAGAALSGRGPLLTHRVVPPSRDGRRVPIPTAHLMRDVAGLLGIRVGGLRPRLYASPETLGRARATLRRAGLGDGEPYALCSPSAAFGSAKHWPPEHFAAVLDHLRRRFGLRPVVTGAPGEELSIEAVAGLSSAAVSLAGEERDLGLLKGLVRLSRIVLVPDSGPRWYAAAFGVPCVSVMGPNFPELTASSLERCEVVRLEGLECAPCLRRTCPLGHHRCMRELAPQAAIEACERLLGPLEAGAEAASDGPPGA